MGLSEEATQMVRGGFEPETFRSQTRHLAIVARPRRHSFEVNSITILTELVGATFPNLKDQQLTFPCFVPTH